MIHSFARQAGAVTEHYVTVIPDPAVAAGEAFAAVASVLQRHGARILQERVFFQSSDQPSLAAARRAAYGPLDDGIEPTWLGCPAGRSGPFAAVQVHAISGGQPPRVHGGGIRVLDHPDAGLVTLSALRAPGRASVADECQGVFDQAVAGLAAHGVSLDRVARTWLWLDPIYAGYADLNRVRNACFRAHGLIAADGASLHLPASTGIGLRPVGGATFALEAIAPTTGVRPKTLAVAGNQRSAFGYGSAFSRAACLPTPSGATWYVSGTAAIDAEGRTVAEGDIGRQVSLTRSNVQAVLRDIGCTPADIVQGVAYCLNPAVEAAWRAVAPSWPLAVVQADICRSNLLFEIELAVCPGARAAVG